MVTLLGRDKKLLNCVRQRFPQAESYTGADSASFRRKTPPDVLVVKLDGTDVAQRRLLAALTGSHRGCATLLCGARAQAFGDNYRHELAGTLVEVAPPGLTDEALLRKVSALTELQRSLYSVEDANYPLLGQTLAYRELMTEVKRVAGFRDPVFVRTGDIEEGVALGRYMHECAGGKGQFVLLRAAQAARADAGSNDDAKALDALLHDARSGTFMIDNLGALPNKLWDLLLAKSNHFAETRLIVGGTLDTPANPSTLLKPLHALALEMPTLHERRADISLFVHHFTLQFNLQGGTHRYLTQAEIDDLMANDFPKDLYALKASVYERLGAKDAAHHAAAPEIEINSIDKTLDECVSDFEARLIEQTLKRCEGNKSKAARLLRTTAQHAALQTRALRHNEQQERRMSQLD